MIGLHVENTIICKKFDIECCYIKENIKIGSEYERWSQMLVVIVIGQQYINQIK